MAEESQNKLIPTDEVIDAKIVAALEEPLQKISEHDKSLADKVDSSSVYDKTTVDSKVKELGDAVAEHVANNTRHIADSEREIWNNKPDSSEIYTRQQSDKIFAHASHEHTNDGWFISVKEEISSKYTKPNGGIPEADMSEEVKTSIGLANTALQEHQDISGKADKAALSAHVANTNNPHAVTAAQVGAVPLVEDGSGEKTAVTIGSRKDGERVGEYSFANGGDVTASVPLSHAEGGDTTASGAYSHAEGKTTTASGESSHSEGMSTAASGNYSHAEGTLTTASGYGSHAEGDSTTASGGHSHAEGAGTTASGDYSHADGIKSWTLSGHYYAFAWNGDDQIEQYTSHGEGTFNINPVGGLDGFYIGEQTLYAILTNKADKADISSTNPTFSNAVLAVGLNIDTNSVAVLNDIAATFGGFPLGAGETATTVGGLLAALAAAVAWLKKNKVGSFESVGGATATVENGVAKLDGFFTESNSLLAGTIDARLPYPLNAVTDETGLLKDRAINTTSLASVTVPDNFTDLLVRASVASSLAVTMPEAIATKYGDTFPGEAGEYLITITKTGAAEAYVRTIKLEEVANA